MYSVVVWFNSVLKWLYDYDKLSIVCLVYVWLIYEGLLKI